MILDLTHTIRQTMPLYPGTKAPSISPVNTLLRNGFRETQMQLSSHTGTHMDAPSHTLNSGSNLNELPVCHFCGRAAVVDVSHITNGIITTDFLRAQNGTVLSADFVLFYTGWEKKWDTPAYYDDTYPVPDADAARYLVSCGLKGVGTDALSVDHLSNSDLTAHHILLEGGIVILESLCLQKVVGRKDIMFFALPIKFENADGAPVRAIAEFRDFPEKEVSDT